MFDKILNDRRNFILLIAAIFLFRVFIGRSVGVFIIIDSVFDDMLMVNYANFRSYFSNQPEFFNHHLLKDMSFPLLLNFVKLSGLQYTDVLAIMYLISALLMIHLFHLATGVNDKKIFLLIYVFVLFTPEAFGYPGMRLYRNSAMIPMYFICLEMIALFFIVHWKNFEMSLKRKIFESLILGLVFTFTFYIQEAGVWILACLVAVIFLCTVKIFLDKFFIKSEITVSEIGLKIIVLILPLVIFSVGTHFYKSVNEKYFGVYVINARTEGELGNFVKNIYKISSNQRTGKIWAPTDAIEKAIEVSPTLQENPKLQNEIFHSHWFGGDIKENPIRGDFLTWVMMSAVKNSGICKNYVEQEQFFKKVNSELETAFENGTLERDKKFQISSSMGGRNLKEIFDLRKLVGKTYFTYIWTANFKGKIDSKILYPEASKNLSDEDKKNRYHEEITKFCNFSNINFFEDKSDFEKIESIANFFLIIYAVLNTSMFILSFVGLIKSFKNQREMFLSVITVGIFLLSLVYSFAIAWFSEFIGYGAIPFYAIGIIPMLMTFEIFGTYLFYQNFFNKNQM